MDECSKCILNPLPVSPTTTTTTTTIITEQLGRERVHPGVKRERRKWSEEETRALLAGMRAHGGRQWAKILHDPVYASALAHRTQKDLKDKMKNLNKAKDREHARTQAQTQAQTQSKDEKDGEVGVTTTDSSSSRSRKAPETPKKLSINNNARKRYLWTSDEETLLKTAVKKYGNSWAEILKDPQFSLFVENKRSRHTLSQKNNDIQ